NEFFSHVFPGRSTNLHIDSYSRFHTACMEAPDAVERMPGNVSQCESYSLLKRGRVAAGSRPASVFRYRFSGKTDETAYCSGFHDGCLSANVLGGGRSGHR